MDEYQYINKRKLVNFPSLSVSSVCEYPDLRHAYSLTHSLRMIYNKATIYEHYDEILNFFVNRSTNASAESFNAKIKAFGASLKGVVDIKFFLFRLAKIYA
jgi:hypothetical protein